jgi:hypothetical protein
MPPKRIPIKISTFKSNQKLFFSSPVAFSSIHSCINISNEKKRQIDHAAAMYN